MNIYVTLLCQFIIWSVFSLAEWLSRYDHFIYKIAMFLIFFHFAFLVGRKILKTGRRAFVVTTVGLVMYGAIHVSLDFLII